MTTQEMRERGWTELDVLLITGDAYVDHPSFGAALIGRVIESAGYRVGIVAQPRWDCIDDIARLGRPRLAVGVTAGNLDSMLAKLTAQKKVRSDDPYAPGGEPGLRPNRATIVYANLAKQAFAGVPVLIGGIEASLRRIAHFDYWQDAVRRSILLDAKADLLLFGMAERSVLEVLDRLKAGGAAHAIDDVRGTGKVVGRGAWEKVAAAGAVLLPSYEQVSTSPKEFAAMTRLSFLESNPYSGRPLIQLHGEQAVVLQPPQLPLSTEELDGVYELPFTRKTHVSYQKPVPALEIVRHSLVATRGCFGGCAFCSLTVHEGRAVQSRSVASLTRESQWVAGKAGVISDVGGPTANMYRMGCSRPELEAVCRRESCVYPQICKHLGHDTAPFLELLRTLRNQQGIRSVSVASGIRHDLAVGSPAFVQELARHHTGGQLSVAPEHASASVLKAMRKPSLAVYDQFAEQFDRASRGAGKDQHLVPYFVSGHPGCTLGDMVELALALAARGIRPRQVQDFIPTPMTMATAMYHTGLDPMSGQPVSVTRSLRDKKLQKSLLLYWDPAQHPWVREALQKAGRTDLIGRGPGKLVPPEGRREAGMAGRERRGR